MVWLNSISSLVSSDELAKDVATAEALLEAHQVSAYILQVSAYILQVSAYILQVSAYVLQVSAYMYPPSECLYPPYYLRTYVYSFVYFKGQYTSSWS